MKCEHKNKIGIPFTREVFDKKLQNGSSAYDVEDWIQTICLDCGFEKELKRHNKELEQ